MFCKMGNKKSEVVDGIEVLLKNLESKEFHLG